MMSGSTLCAGDWVEVRSPEEILATLDRNGELEGLPFMPEMLAFCGQRFRVLKRAHKTCDPPNGIGGRRMLHAVHLDELRCDGSGHGGCQARCLIFWKEKWLKRVGGNAIHGSTRQRITDRGLYNSGNACTTNDLLARACSRLEPDLLEERTYACQSTQIDQATQTLKWYDFGQYIEDYTSGNVRLSEFASAVMFSLYETVASAGIGIGTPLRWLYDRTQRFRGGGAYPARPGRVPRGARTPSHALQLKAGDVVKVRSYSEILDTLNEVSHNRGMYFDPEMVPYCGGTFRVLDRVQKIVDERTGKMRVLKNDCIMLERVVCRARFAKHRRFCPRAIYAYWREIWLERVSDLENTRH